MSEETFNCWMCKKPFPDSRHHRGLCPPCETKDDQDTELMIEDYFESLPVLTEEEQRKQLEDYKKCDEYILKHGITPNLDFPEN